MSDPRDSLEKAVDRSAWKRAIADARADERARCASIADDRAKRDHERYQNETDWRMPYALNRVLRASMDIAAAIRDPKSDNSTDITHE